MAIAESSRTRLAFIKEVTEGVTPATPAFKNARYTGESLKIIRQNITSDEIRADRNITDLIQVGGGVEGSMEFELSYGAFDLLLEGALCGAFTTNNLKNGVARSSFTFEKMYDQGGSPNTFVRYTGCIVNTMSLQIQSQQIVTGTFGFMGRAGTTGTAILAGATYTDSAANPVMNAANNFAALSITGAGSPKLTGLTLEINNNTRMQPVIGSLETAGVGLGRFDVKGTATIYFEDKAAYDLFLAGTAADLTFSIGGASTLKYVVTIPKLKFSDADIPVSGNDADIILTLPFQGLYDTTLQATMNIQRVP